MKIQIRYINYTEYYYTKCFVHIASKLVRICKMEHAVTDTANQQGFKIIKYQFYRQKQSCFHSLRICTLRPHAMHKGKEAQISISSFLRSCSLWEECLSN